MVSNMQAERSARQLRGLAIIAWLVLWMGLLIGLLALTGKLAFWPGTVVIALTGVLSFFLVALVQERRLRHR